MVFYIFNPENDLALAFGQENYTAPPLAMQLREDLATLPRYYAGQDCALFRDATAVQLQDCKIVPWGWNIDLRKRLITQGVPERCLPSKDYINRLRDLSHRRTSVALHRRVCERVGQQLSPAPVEYSQWQDVLEFAHAHKDCFVKAPWSSSGRGIYRGLQPDSIDFNHWCSGIIKRQGSIICEEALAKVQDFAMEFYARDGRVKFVGYSVFYNDSQNSFDHALVAHEDVLLIYIVDAAGGNSDLIQQLRTVLCEILTEDIAPYYEGYIGVDMMVYRCQDGTLGVNPCVEVNLRTTMGVVTSIIGNTMLREDETRKFYVRYFKTHDDLQASITPAMQLLTPVTPDTRYLCYLE